ETRVPPPDLDEMAGLDLVYAAEGSGAGNDRLHQLVKESVRLELAGNVRVGEQRLQFGTEYDAFAGLCPVERLDAEAVAHQEQGVLLLIVEGKCEFAAQLGQRAGKPEAGVEVQHQLRIALAAKAGALGREVCADTLVVVKLPVLGEHEALVRGAEG